MYEIFIGSLILSTIHALIPNHWLPLIAVGKTENWTRSQTQWATVITGVSHTLSTIIIGIVVGIIGYKLATRYAIISETIAPGILITLGMIYIFRNFYGSHHHDHAHRLKADLNGKIEKRSRRVAILTSLSIAMFLTPCVEIEAYYFHAGTIGWTGIFIVSAIYLLVTVVIMLSLVSLGMSGVQTFKAHFLEHHEKGITGVVLIALGIIAWFVKF
jgi:nickel/cobalt transporter (NicO) family protein